ncbi:unnamed protein product [Lota lota]
MAEPVRSAFQSGVTRVTSSRKTWMEAEEDEEEEVEYEEAEDAPIFSRSKSSVDVLTATEPMHPWDPALTRQDIRRSSSTNTHTEHHTCTRQQLRARRRHEDAAAASKAFPIPHRSPLGPGCGSPPLSERWSACSTRSDCSTPDSVIWRGGAVRPQSLVQGAPASKLASPASPPPTFDSPIQTPPISPSTRPPLPLNPCRQQQPMSSTIPASPTPEGHATPPMPPSTLPPISPELRRLPSMENEHMLTNNCSPSPTLPSHRSFSPGMDVGARTGSQQQAHLVQASEELPSVSGSTRPVVGGEDEYTLLTQIEEQESPRQDKLPRKPGSSSPDFGVSRRWKSPLVSSLSDTGLSVYCRCSCGLSRLETLASRPQGGKDSARDEAQETPRSPVKSVDAAVQTASPPGSWLSLRKNMSYMFNSHMGSHSILGSPPGSRLNLRSPVGSTSNLVSPSSSMFFQDVGEDQEEKEEEEKKSKDSSLVWETSTAAVQPQGRRRSCLKVPGDERVRGEERVRVRGELGRRGSMKQVQWDEEGMTWDIYGSSLDAEELDSAIERHLNLRVGKERHSPPPPRNKWRMKTATKVAKATALGPKEQGASTALGPKAKAKANPKANPKAKAKAAVDAEGEAKAKAESALEKGKGKKQELAADVCGKRKLEVKREKGNGEGEEEGTPEHTPPPPASPRLAKGVKWSLTKPCCGGSSEDHH